MVVKLFALLVFAATAIMCVVPSSANSLSNSKVIEIVRDEPEEIEWDGKNTSDIFKRLKRAEQVTLNDIATRHALSQRRVRAEARTLIDNWRAKYGQDHIFGLVRLEGALTGVNVVLHQHDTNIRVLAIATKEIKARIMRGFLHTK